MIPTRDNERQVTSTVQGDKIAMSIDQAAMAHIMNVLTDLYSDPERAVIREYSTNARDAHIEAGVTEPIRVTTPSPFSPFLTIQDFGIGLSPDDIEAIYSRYGASTKRASNDVVGMLGLGCKSALTYAEQFTLVGIKDGIRQQVLISRDADGAGSMTVVTTDATTERNGVTITIPVKKEHRFEQKANEFFCYWPEGSVLLNGAAPKPHDARPITKNLFLDASRLRDRYADKGQDVVVMGGVPYPANLDPHDRLVNKARLIAYVPIGTVEFTPSREALQMTPKTAAAVNKLCADIYAQLDAAILRDVDQQLTKPQALRAMNEWDMAVRGGGHRQYTWQGQPIPETLTAAQGTGAPTYGAPSILLTRLSTYTLSSTSSYNVLEVSLWPTCVFIKNYSGKWTAPRRKKLDKFVAELSNPPTDYTYYVLFSGDPTPTIGGWVEPARILDWADVSAIKLDRAYTVVNGAPARLLGSYDLIDENGVTEQCLAKDIRTSEPLFFLRGNRYSAHAYVNYLGSRYGKFTLVFMPKNRVDKFRRDFPVAKELYEFLRDEAKTWASNLTKDEQTAIAMEDAGLRDCFRVIDGTKVVDPAIKEAARLAKINIDKPLKERKTLNQVSPTSMSQNGWKSPIGSNYPIFDPWNFERSSQAHKREHWYIYLNAAFTQATP